MIIHEFSVRKMKYMTILSIADLTLASPKVVAHTVQLWFQDLNYQHI